MLKDELSISNEQTIKELESRIKILEKIIKQLEKNKSHKSKSNSYLTYQVNIDKNIEEIAAFKEALKILRRI